MDPKLLILIALTNGAKTPYELSVILKDCLDGRRANLQSCLHTLFRASSSTRRPIAIRSRDDGYIELTTEGHAWMIRHPVIRFVVDSMNRVERHGFPRGESIAA